MHFVIILIISHVLKFQTEQVEEILQQAKEEPPEIESSDASAMVLDATAEFCRTLGDIPTYGLAGNRDHLAEIMVSGYFLYYTQINILLLESTEMHK